MNNFFIQNTLVTTICKLIIIATICLGLSSCAYIKSFRGGKDQNAAVARSIKSELILSPAVEAAPLQVQVEDKTIILDGFVESLEEKQEAERLARELYPSYEILNTISVR